MAWRFLCVRHCQVEGCCWPQLRLQSDSGRYAFSSLSCQCCSDLYTTVQQQATDEQMRFILTLIHEFMKTQGFKFSRDFIYKVVYNSKVEEKYIMFFVLPEMSKQTYILRTPTSNKIISITKGVKSSFKMSTRFETNIYLY